jgi:NAD(P)-dependent dehydrogenase (short-subunit alcohol dehydrogenase family)
VLVNNDGGFPNTRHVTADGLERTFALNHLAPFLLTSLLLDRLTHSAPAQGTATSIHLASAPDLEQVTGRYFASSKPRKSSKRSYDQAAAIRLWQVSADLTGLTAAGVTTTARPAGRLT